MNTRRQDHWGHLKAGYHRIHMNFEGIAKHESRRFQLWRADKLRSGQRLMEKLEDYKRKGISKTVILNHQTQY